jgi:DNA helicase IV
MSKEVLQQALDALDDTGLKWRNVVAAIQAVKEEIKRLEKIKLENDKL